MMTKYQNDLKNIKEILKTLLILDVIVYVSGAHYILAPIALLNATMFSVGLLRSMDIAKKMKKHQHQHG